MSLTTSPTLSEAALEARRSNAANSTGPRTESGKARSRLNALQHGGYASPGAWTDAALRALGEDPGAFHDLSWRFKKSDGPGGDPLWEYAAEDLARQVWRRQRLDRAWETLAGRSAARGKPSELVAVTSEGMTILAQIDAAERAVDRKMRVLLRLREAEARRQRERLASARRKVRQQNQHEKLGFPPDLPTDEDLARARAANLRLREEMERCERVSPSLLEDDDPLEATPTPARADSPAGVAESPALSSGLRPAPTSDAAESASVAAGLKPAPSDPSETSKSPERSGDVVEKKEARSQEPEARSAPSASSHPLFVLWTPEPGVREDGISEWGV